MRIILMTPSMSKGGAETQLLKIADFLRSNGHQVQLLSLKPINEFGGAIEQMGIPVVFLKSWRGHIWRNIGRMIRLMLSFKPDVVIAFMFIAIIFARLLKLRYRFCLISTIRISVIPRKWKYLFQATNGLDDALVYNSVAAQRNFEAHNARLKRGMVIHNGISLPDLPMRVSLANQAQESPVFSWVCIAHFRWNKDYMTLFRAISLLKGHNFNVKVIGELAGLSWPQEVINTFSIQEHVSLLGFQSDSTAYLKSADAFVLSSFSEGMPNAILEAMAHAKPTVVSDIDGNRELICAANCGFLCEQGNAELMASNMLKVMNMTDAGRLSLGDNGRRYIEDCFAEAKVMKEWMQLIKEITD
ncbi:putative LPS biosynthesis related glycosyltransferase [Pedobacter sp. BAL39]|nr:putative LPS biosynthesis related glycosyltransferase [Pedobacter sp. BAL39]